METFGNQTKQFLSNQYSCEKCNYNTVRKSNFDTHILSAKHKRNHNINQIISNKYICEKCNYNTSRKSNYDNHVLSIKHVNTRIQHICE